VVEFVGHTFIPVRVHVKENRAAFERFNAQWTPTQIVLDENGVERHRLEGFLPKDDILAQLELGLARLDFEAGRFDRAMREFEQVVEKHPRATAAPQARYWAGVSRYKASNDPGALKETAQAIESRWPGSEWARKASVWAG
jgi:TolA-binding protein